MSRSAVSFTRPRIAKNVIAKTGLDPSHSAGLFVGVRDYCDAAVSPVAFAVDDAVDLAHLFSLELGLLVPSKVFLAITGEPVKAESQQRLATLLAKGAQRSRPTLYELYNLSYRVGRSTEESGLYVSSFAGHGFNDQGASLFCPEDLLYRRFLRTSLDLAATTDDIDQAKADRKLVLIDACRFRRTTDRAFGDGLPANQGFLDTFLRIRGLAALFATCRGGYSYDDPERRNGVFSSFVIDGLRGDAALPGKPFITIGALSQFVNLKVGDWVKTHRESHEAKHRGVFLSCESDDMRELPLAENAKTLREKNRQTSRIGLAIQRLHGEIKPPITGTIFDRVCEFLEAEPSGDLMEEVLAAIERLDGSIKGRRSLMFLVERELDPGDLRPVAAPADPQVRSLSLGTEPLSPLPDVVEKDRNRISSRRSKSHVLESHGLERGPAWAVDFGRDDAGRWADLPISGALVQKMRFIEPGQFLMGPSPGDAGRNGNEGQRRRVEIPEGFWLADTPCTQQVWQAVMKRNGSRFRSPSRPVECVGWNDSQAFCIKLAAQFSGLDFMLPTEAQWEYACRAGSGESTYAGNPRIEGLNAAPLLDPIAWYAGNSGQEFDLSDGEDVSNWPEKLYAAAAAGTRPVGGKKGNGWGLYDTLGNVWEWCQDEWQEQHGFSSGVGDGLLRAIRGASWKSAPAEVRAARRDWRSTTTKSHDLGFRFLLQSRKGS